MTCIQKPPVLSVAVRSLDINLLETSTTEKTTLTVLIVVILKTSPYFHTTISAVFNKNPLLLHFFIFITTPHNKFSLLFWHTVYLAFCLLTFSNIYLPFS